MNVDYTHDDDKRLCEWLGIPEQDCVLTAPTAESDYWVLDAMRAKARLDDFLWRFPVMVAFHFQTYLPGDYARAAFAVMQEQQ